jgi:NADPH2:quinone reductase
VESPGEISVREVEVPEPGEEEVLVDVKASGVCHSDETTLHGYRDIDYPRIPGHEVAGIVEEAGDEVENWEEGDRVAVGWHGGHCFNCELCKNGRFLKCENKEVTGVDRDGGHAEYMVARQESLAQIPEGVDYEDAAPLMCAGVTTFNALRNTEARPGDLVAIQGIGGLGHLGVQFSSESGFETVAISHSSNKKDYALELGADRFIDSSEKDIASQIQDMRSAKVILATAPDKEAIESTVGALGIEGELKIVGIPGEPVEVLPVELIDRDAKVSGHASGTPSDSEDTLQFSEMREIKPETELFSLEDYEGAFDKMENGQIRFRAVIKP